MNANLSYGMRRDYVPVPLNMEMCKRLNCTTEEKDMPKSELIVCPNKK